MDWIFTKFGTDVTVPDVITDNIWRSVDSVDSVGERRRHLSFPMTWLALTRSRRPMAAEIVFYLSVRLLKWAQTRMHYLDLNKNFWTVTKKTSRAQPLSSLDPNSKTPIWPRPGP